MGSLGGPRPPHGRHRCMVMLGPESGRKRVGKKGMAKKGSKAYKVAKKAGEKINKDEKNESALSKSKKNYAAYGAKNEDKELKNPKKADLDKDG